MKKFLLSYWIGILILFTLFYWETSILSLMLNQFQTDLTVLWTSFLVSPPAFVEGDYIVITERYRLLIEKSCNGIVPYLFFLASIFAFPATLLHKVLWAMIGYIVLIAMNLFRIWLITEFVLVNQQYFALVHDVIGNLLLMATALGLFVLFIKRRKDYLKPPSPHSLFKKKAPINEVSMTSAI